MLLACDSLGVRSLAMRVKDLLIDPGAALGPSRYGLPPHQLEEQALAEALVRIEKELARVKRVAISHYHYDHYLPLGDYSGKLLYLKDWEENINRSQRGRAAEFLEHLEGQDVEIEKADGRDFGDVEFSPAVPHGPEGSRLGYVLMVRVGDLVHASDVQGPQSPEAARWIIEQAPRVLVLSGFPTLFLGWRTSRAALEKSNDLLRRILESGVETLVLDHHLLRDRFYRRRIKPVLDCAERKGARVMTGAEFTGKKPRMLEAFRRELHRGAGIREVERLSGEAVGD